MAKNRFLHILARFYTLKTAKNWNQSLWIVYGSIILKFFLVAQETHTHQWFDRQNYRQQKCFFGTPYCILPTASVLSETLTSYFLFFSFLNVWKFEFCYRSFSICFTIPLALQCRQCLAGWPKKPPIQCSPDALELFSFLPHKEWNRDKLHIWAEQILS